MAKSMQQCYGLGLKQTKTPVAKKQAGRLFSSFNQTHRETGHLYKQSRKNK